MHVKLVQLNLQHRSIGENKSVQRLILGGCRDMFHVSEMIEERSNFSRTQCARMLPTARPVTVEFQEPPHPKDVGFLGTQGVVFDAEDFAQLVEQFGLGVGNNERSLCRTHFRGHNVQKCNRGRQIRNKNLFVARRGYTAFSLPNTC